MREQASTGLLSAFADYPREKELIGQMVLAYGELEFCLLGIVAAVLESAEAALRTLYQLRSEASRIEVTHAIAKPFYVRFKLDGALHEGMVAIKHCSQIRNRYAHRQFLGIPPGLCITDLDQPARSKTDKAKISPTLLTLELLERQWTYFNYTDHMLLWLVQEYRRQAGLDAYYPDPVARPKRIDPGTLHKAPT